MGLQCVLAGPGTGGGPVGQTARQVAAEVAGPMVAGLLACCCTCVAATPRVGHRFCSGTGVGHPWLGGPNTLVPGAHQRSRAKVDGVCVPSCCWVGLTLSCCHIWDAQMIWRGPDGSHAVKCTGFACKALFSIIKSVPFLEQQTVRVIIY